MSTHTEYFDPQGDAKLMEDMQTIASKLAPARSDEVLSLDFSAASVAQAAERLRSYIARRRAGRGLDVNVVHTFDAGDSSEASLMLSDIEILLEFAYRAGSRGLDDVVRKDIKRGARLSTGRVPT